jgi:hypothetical protein
VKILQEITRKGIRKYKVGRLEEENKKEIEKLWLSYS